ncbi:MAG: 30S ribosomal protein S20 [Chloroflexi bacterium]|nr:30S ribosomal protein S20 [Chloroflexota bacterium]
MSSERAHRRSAKRAVPNKASRTRLRSQVKTVRGLLQEGTQPAERLTALASYADRLAHKGVIHRNKAARLKGRLARQARKTQAAAQKPS